MTNVKKFVVLRFVFICIVVTIIELMEKVLQKHRGVGFDKRRNTWFATIKLNGKSKYLGAFGKFEDAIAKRLQAENEYRLPEQLKRLEFEKTIVDDYNNGLSLNAIGKKINFCPSSVRDILLKHNVNIRNNENNIDEEKCLALYDSGKTMEVIANEFGVSIQCIRHKLLKHNRKIRPNRKYFFDETIFEKINCEWKAYYLGLFCADGGVCNNSIKLSLHEKDKILIDKLNEVVYDGKYTLDFCPHTIRISKRTGKIFNNNPKYGIQINSKKVVEDLNKLGCGKRKSLILTFPSFDIVPEPLFQHFIRGYFDGDGWFSFPTFGIISSDEFCFGMQKFLWNSFNMTSYLCKAGKVSRLLVHKKEDIKKLYDYLYFDATIFLERKRSKFYSK